MKTRTLFITGFFFFFISAIAHAQTSTTTTTYYGNTAGNAKYPCKGSSDAVCKTVTIVNLRLKTGKFYRHITQTYITYEGNLYSIPNGSINFKTGDINSETIQWVGYSKNIDADNFYLKEIVEYNFLSGKKRN